MMRSAPPIESAERDTATTAEGEEGDGSDEQPDVERVELHHEQRVEREDHDLEGEHRNRDA